MRKLLLLLAASTALGLATGCGVAESDADIRAVAAQSIDMDMRQIVDDWNTIWLVDRQYRLTKWTIR